MPTRTMDIVFIHEELAALRDAYSKVPGAELVSCVPELVQIRITRTKHKQLLVNYHFPEGYPTVPIVLELKSRRMSDRLLEGLVKVAEEEAKKIVAERQVLQMTKFLRKFLDDTPLCVCSEEIAHVKRKVLGPDDVIKLKQKTSQVVLKLTQGSYKINTNLNVPDEYPVKQLDIEISDQNLPEVIKTNYLFQAIEISRRAVQAPLKPKPKAPPFEAKPSLADVVEYFVRIIRTFPGETCPVCQEPALPADAKDVTNDQKDPRHVERMYCNHLYHQGCIDTYMKTPPFSGGKKCLRCGNRLFHEKWKTPAEVQEMRWAHKEARRRELDEVVDFLE